MYEDLIETKLESENIFDGNLLHIKKDKVKLPNGGEAYREWVKHPGAAAVIPLTDQGEITSSEKPTEVASLDKNLYS